MEKTLVLLKPDAIARGFVGTIIKRFEEKGLKLIGIKMMILDDSILDDHYSHLKGKSFYIGIKSFMKSLPVIATCWEGVEAVDIVRGICGITNARKANVGTIRGDYSMSMQTNLIHASDTPENAVIEINRFFKNEDIFTYDLPILNYLYSEDEINK